MKPLTTHPQNHLVCIGAALLLLLSVNPAKAQILLTVNVSDPSNVIITATGNALNNGVSASDDLYDGVELLGFFTSTTHNDTFGINSSTLAPGSGSADGSTYNGAAGDNLAETSDIDLALFNLTLPNSAAEDFSSSSAAFTGSMSLDLSNYSLPLVNSTGTITTGFNNDGGSHVAIGTYEVVATSAPEPSSWILFAASLVLFAFYQARRILMRVGAKAEAATFPGLARRD